MRALVADAGLDAHVELDSAGTGGWHAGDPPDARAIAAAARRGITIDGTARQISHGDFERFDILVALDASNASGLLGVAPDERSAAKVRLLREFDPAFAGGADLDVPDPYYGGEDGFDHVLDLVDAACRGLLEVVRERAGAA